MNPAAPIDPGSATFRRVAVASTLLLLAGSWPLWAEGGAGAGLRFPRVPFVAGLPALPGLRWGLVLALGVGLLGRGWRAGLVVASLLAGYAVLRDQNRLQPWLGQFLADAAVLVLATGPRAVPLLRALAIALYFWSGVSKLDASFVRELGPAFLDAGLGLAGRSAANWPWEIRAGAILLMPAWEVAVAIGLARARTRRLALAGAIAQHAALVAVLGPWALDQSPNVLVWNAAMIARDLALFGRAGPTAIVGPRTWGDRLALAVVVALVALPAGEPWGWWDAWPSHALYASHTGRADVLIHEDDAGLLPPSVRARLGPGDPAGYRRLDLTGWSRDELGTPIYPQNRVRLAVAASLAGGVPTFRPVVAVEWDPAGRLNGRRPVPQRWVGGRAIRARAGRERFGAVAEAR